MKILGIDTSTKFLCLGICDDRRIYGYNLEVERRLSVLLTVTIQRTLDAAGLKPKDVDYFACGLGPGSFTGLRIGASAIKGLGWALHKPVIGISSLDIIAKNAGISDRPLVTVIDARRNLLYCGFFTNKDGRLKKTKPYMLLNQKEFLKKVPAGSILLGDAVSLYREEWIRNIRSVTLLDKDAWYPKPHHLMALVLERIKEGRLGCAFDIKPIYLYPKECQIKSVTRNQ